MSALSATPSAAGSVSTIANTGLACNRVTAIELVTAGGEADPRRCRE
jgi:hypothetical protein